MKVLFIAEIVGKAGLFTVKKLLPQLKEEHNIDFVIASADGVTGGFGMGKNHSIYLRKLGIDVLTTGECVYYKKDMAPHIAKAPYILRGANYPATNPGRGWRYYNVGDKKIAVVNILGQAGFNRLHLTNPFFLIEGIVEKIKKETNIIIVDFHASTTAEKTTMYYHLDGKVSAVIGTHTKAQSADARVLPGGSAVICDAGRTGSIQSVGGFDSDIEIKKFLTAIPERSGEAWDGLELQGVLLDINDDGRANSIDTLRIPCKEVPDGKGSD
ncbi:TIGR00282 family metallophosphoesterase [Spirochaeta cellobiosiphila]|uniref:TIGR00282 family metallophosphoesterase n=1 Tax=Spirochaeta cellobiosiphila TaxID=504483 RepID=UPI00316AD92A